MFYKIFRFELAFHARQPTFYVVSLIMFLVAFGAAASSNISIGGTIPGININSPYNVISMLSILASFATLLAGVVYAANPLLRDFNHNVAELFFTTSVSRFNYLFGRFCGAMLFPLFCYLAAVLGIFLGELMPWVDDQRLGPLRLDAYWFATWAIAIPNILLMGSLVFLVATVVRSLLGTFLAIFSLEILESIIGALIYSEDTEFLSIMDLFGARAMAEITRYWTPFEMNELVVPMEGNLLYNRLLVMGLIGIFLVLAYRLFPLSMDIAGSQNALLQYFRRRRKTKAQESSLAKRPHEEPLNNAAMATEVVNKNIPGARLVHDVVRRFDISAQFAQFWSLLRIEFHNIIIGKGFLIALLLGLIVVIFTAVYGLPIIFNTNVYPTTSVLVGIINGSYSLPVLVVTIFYSGELLVRDRNVEISEMLDSMPHSNWVIISAKLLALMSVIAVMLLVAMIGGIMVQIGLGFYDIEILHYLLGLFTFFSYPVWFTCVLAVFMHVITGNRFLGIIAVVLFFGGSIILAQQGFDHNLYLFSTPVIPWSIFTGWGPNLSAFVWFSIYWTLFCLLLLIVMYLLWLRGTEVTGRFRWSRIKPRLTAPVAGAAAVIFGLFIASGGFIYYNTNVLNEHLSWLEVEALVVEYEKTYKQYEDMRFPDIVDIYTEIDIYPQRREAHIEGRYLLANNYDTDIPELHLNYPQNLRIAELEVPDAELISADTRLGYYIYEFDRPMRPGETMTVNFTLDWLTPGFTNSGSAVGLLSNGSFFTNLDVFPTPGYSKVNEILRDDRRRRYGLPPAQRTASIDDESKYDQNLLGFRQRVGYEAIISTSDEQLAVTPGYLLRQWEEDGRRYFHYKMDQKIWPFLSYLSADYEVKADKWNEVDIEVYYKHDYNVDRMIEASKKALDYYTANFSPYQYRQYRIFEFPVQHGVFAQSFPNTIPFSEAIGFVADIRDPQTIDDVFYVTAHELAHQWWAHQVNSANVQGAAVLSEVLSQYSAVMVMEKEYGADYMQRVLRYELNRYLTGRGIELLGELPVMLAENQAYIHYGKGALVMYALKDYLGEETVNQALREFIAEWAFKGPPYPTARHLVDKFREVADSEYQSVITDLFEKIVLFDLRAEDSFYTELDDGTFDVTINVTAKKFEADSRGRETEVDLNALLDIGVLGEADAETGIPAVLYLQREQIDQEQQSFTVNVSSRPVSAGIDPFNKMIDRDPDDNVTTLSEAED